MLATRITAATPATRDRAVDALRAFAILGVVLGHWLVTALVSHGNGARFLRLPAFAAALATCGALCRSFER